MLRRVKTRVTPSAATVSAARIASTQRDFSARSGGNNNNRGGNSSVQQFGQQQNQNSNQNQNQQRQANPFGGSFEEQMVSLGASVFGQMANAMARRTSSGDGSNNNNPLANMFAQMGEMARVKEWTCWCGHKFQAPGMWVPTERALCQAPGCPNPKYFTEGEGARLLEQGKGGTPLQSRDVSNDGGKKK